DSGQTVKLVALVRSAGTAKPGGVVTFFDGNTPIATASLDEDGDAVTNVKFAVGTHPLTAVYGATPAFAGSTSPVVTETIVAPAAVREFPIPTFQSNATSIARGPDGNLWFTEGLTGAIGRITPAGAITEFTTGITAGAQPNEITAGPDGNLWFTEQF